MHNMRKVVRAGNVPRPPYGEAYADRRAPAVARPSAVGRFRRGALLAAGFRWEVGAARSSRECAVRASVVSGFPGRMRRRIGAVLHRFNQNPRRSVRTESLGQVVHRLRSARLGLVR